MWPSACCTIAQRKSSKEGNFAAHTPLIHAHHNHLVAIIGMARLCLLINANALVLQAVAEGPE
jgi:hypothetical protein